LDTKSRQLPDRIAVGVILRPHGLRGEVVVESLTDFDARFDPGSQLLVEGSSKLLGVATSRAHKGRFLIRFADCVDRDAAEALRGVVLEVPRSRVPPVPDGAFYHYELIDCAVHDRQAGDLGVVVDVLEDGGGLLLEVSDGSRRLLLPFVRSYLSQVDVAAGRIECDLPEGLIEACASTS
jgi:16S rRNA processing protein RimM